MLPVISPQAYRASNRVRSARNRAHCFALPAHSLAQNVALTVLDQFLFEELVLQLLVFSKFPGKPLVAGDVLDISQEGLGGRIGSFSAIIAPPAPHAVPVAVKSQRIVFLVVSFNDHVSDGGPPIGVMITESNVRRIEHHDVAEGRFDLLPDRRVTFRRVGAMPLDLLHYCLLGERLCRGDGENRERQAKFFHGHQPTCASFGWKQSHGGDTDHRGQGCLSTTLPVPRPSAPSWPEIGTSAISPVVEVGEAPACLLGAVTPRPPAAVAACPRLSSCPVFRPPRQGQGRVLRRWVLAAGTSCGPAFSPRIGLFPY